VHPLLNVTLTVIDLICSILDGLWQKKSIVKALGNSKIVYKFIIQNIYMKDEIYPSFF